MGPKTPRRENGIRLLAIEPSDQPVFPTGSVIMLTSIPYAGTRRPLGNLVSVPVGHPPMPRQAYVIRWTKVFHFHLLPLLDDLRLRATVRITLASVMQYLEVSPLYSSSIFSVNMRIAVSPLGIERIIHATLPATSRSEWRGSQSK
jgi:hypothetical protein